VLYLQLIILSVGGDVPIDSELLLVTDFVNLKIKLAQSFRGAHRGMMCMCVFIGVSARTCMSIYICTVFLKKWGCANKQKPEILLHNKQTRFNYNHGSLPHLIIGMKTSS
jgi:hypothetical protein